jgi:lipopolysaccharide/colanic/teichoic acid biosynthesis glycosyltransferase
VPAPLEQRRWRTFPLLSFEPETQRGIGCGYRDLLLRFLPALVNVVKGDLSLVGVPPRTPEEVALLPQDWQNLYLRAKAGIITEVAVRHGADADASDQYAGEAFYVATANWRYDLNLMLRFLALSLLGVGRPRRPVPVGTAAKGETAET